MRELLHSVALRAARYLEDIQERRVSPSAEAVRGLTRFDEPLPEGSTAPEDVIRMLDEVGSPATMGVAGRRFFGFVLGGSLPAALGGSKDRARSGHAAQFRHDLRHRGRQLRHDPRDGVR